MGILRKPTFSKQEAIDVEGRQSGFSMLSKQEAIEEEGGQSGFSIYKMEVPPSSPDKYRRVINY